MVDRRAAVATVLLCTGCTLPFWGREQYEPKPSRPVEELRTAILANVPDATARAALLEKLDSVRGQYQRRDKQRHDLEDQVAQLRYRLMRLEKYQVTKIELHPLTGLQDADRDGRPEVLEVHVRTLDRQGDDVLKTDGVFAFGLRRQTSDGITKRTSVLGRWRCKAGDDARDNPGRVFNHHVFRLPIRNVVGELVDLVVTARLEAEGEEPLTAELRLRPEPKREPAK